MDNKAIAEALVGLAKSLAASEEKVAADIAELTPDQQAKVNEIVEATDTVEQLKKKIKAASGKLESELRALQKKAKALDEELGPVVAAASDQLVRAKKAVVKYNPTMSQRPSYQAAYESALSKVNANTKAVLEECLEATRKIASYLDIEMTASENKGRRRLAGVLDFIGNMFHAFVEMMKSALGIKEKTKRLEQSIDALEKVVA